MKVTKYSNENFKHSYIISEETLHYGGQRWIMQQLDEKGAILPREQLLNAAEYNKMIEELQKQGWKPLLLE